MDKKARKALIQAEKELLKAERIDQGILFPHERIARKKKRNEYQVRKTVSRVLRASARADFIHEGTPLAELKRKSVRS